MRLMRPAALAVLALLAALPVMAAESPIVGGSGDDPTTVNPIEPAQVFGGEMTYFADAAQFSECMTGRSYPIAMERDYLALERAYLGAVREPGAPLYVTFEGALAERPRMEGGGSERTVVVDRFINVWPHERCERAAAHAALANTYWRIVRLRGDAVQVVEGHREPHLILRRGDGRHEYSATVGCNRLAGVYAVDGATIRLEPAVATLLPCPAPLDALERTLELVLAQVSRWRISGNTLELLDASGSSLALLEAVYLR